MLPKAPEIRWFGAGHIPLAIPIGLALFILAGTILFGSQYVRQKSRKQITAQHAQILYALWLSQKTAEDLESGLSLSEEPSDHLPAVLETAQLPQLLDLLGTRVFDADGEFWFADAHVSEATLGPEDLAQLRELNPVARLHEHADLGQVSLAITDPSPNRGPLLEVSIPLHPPSETRLVGVAQFILDGANVADEFRRLDRHLILQASLTFVVAGGLLVLILGASFRQLHRMNRLLSERTQSLLHANQELALAAKTSAVGAVTAHLIHGLKNPLSGLHSFMSSRAADPGKEETHADWQLAVSSTRRMQAMISDIVRVLGDEETSSQYELSLEEFVQMTEAKVRPLAREAGIAFNAEVQGNAVLRNREANLLSLVLHNLLQNAIQATPRGQAVGLAVRANAGRVACEVRDQGPGISPEQHPVLFKPCRSVKEGGSGIGLAISKQLASSIGAELNLQETSSRGSVFVLSFECRPGGRQQTLAAESLPG